MAFYFPRHTMFKANYMKKYSTYKPTKFKRLDDLSATNKNPRAPISVIFLVRKLDNKKFNIPPVFQVPNTLLYNKPHYYH